MKNKILITLLCLFSFACGTIIIDSNRTIGQSMVPYSYEETTVDGMKYGVFVGILRAQGSGGNVAGGIHVINITKDKLEVEMLQNELRLRNIIK